MSANDVLDVLNISRDDQKGPAKKRQKTSTPVPRQTGMARELYNLLGPNTPPVNLTNTSNVSSKDKIKFKVSPWTRMPFNPNKGKKTGHEIILNHWVKGSQELLEQEDKDKPYFFEKFDVKLDIPQLVDEETFDAYMEEIRDHQKKVLLDRKQREKEKKVQEARERERRDKEKQKALEQAKSAEKSQEKSEEKKSEEKGSQEKSTGDKSTDKSNSDDKEGEEAGDKEGDEKEAEGEEAEAEGEAEAKAKEAEADKEDEDDEEYLSEPWTYEETKYLFELCNSFELKWPIIYDRYNYGTDRSPEDLREQFYTLCIKILDSQENKNTALIDSLRAYSKYRELDRKQYLENLLKRTPAEIAEEESLVIEARRFEMAAKKMLIERSHLLTLLDSPQSTQQVQQYLSSQGITNLYNHLMILDKNQKKRQLQQQQKSPNGNQEPIPPPIPVAASSSFKKDKSFQTHLQQYLAGVLKQNQNTTPASRQEANAIQQLLMKRLTQKEEEAYGLYFHGSEKLTPGVTLRSNQRLPGLQQKSSVLKSVNQVLQELDIPTAGGTNWKPVMPTRKTMTMYDELLKSVVALLELKKGKDKLESEITLIKSQRGLE
ncbi:uncharacterized protein RJT21DRAFT_109464 [Scheffersomyces amazonensis]|uniref:uncharacterized protein n=1 Tax=Scheffersomyces amazonensis TaxID=1078765 RepID=UPI00315CF652